MACSRVSVARITRGVNGKEYMSGFIPQKIKNFDGGLRFRDLDPPGPGGGLRRAAIGQAAIGQAAIGQAAGRPGGRAASVGHRGQRLAILILNCMAWVIVDYGFLCAS